MGLIGFYPGPPTSRPVNHAAVAFVCGISAFKKASTDSDDFDEWRRRSAAELEHLEEAHHRAVGALGGERSTKKKIDALIEADIGEVLKFALGGEAITATRAYKRGRSRFFWELIRLVFFKSCFF